MAKFYGAKVGAVKQLNPLQLVDMAFENTKDSVLVRDTIVVTAIGIGDVIQLARLGWETVLNPQACSFACDAIGVGGTVSIGDVTFPTALASGVNTDAAALPMTPMMSAVPIANYFLPLWQTLGYATLAAARLVGDNCELLMTRNTAVGGAGKNIVWQMGGQKRI